MAILVTGSSGKMGMKVMQALKENAYEAIGIDSHHENKENRDLLMQPRHEGLIDFSSPSMLDGILTYAINRQVPLVLAVTGYTKEQQARIEEASHVIPIFQSSNLSFGIHIVNKVLKEVVPLLQGYDCEILEAHHRYKKDAPSGTAMTLLNTILAAKQDGSYPVYDRSDTFTSRNDLEIGMHALRMGSVFGEHSVYFSNQNEILEFKHTALSKDVFASGAVKALTYVQQQGPGLYGMDDIL